MKQNEDGTYQPGIIYELRCEIDGEWHPFYVGETINKATRLGQHRVSANNADDTSTLVYRFIHDYLDAGNIEWDLFEVDQYGEEEGLKILYGRAWNMANEEVETLDELRFDTLKKYMIAARKRMNALTGAGVQPKGTSSTSRELRKRIKGYRNAWEKVNRKVDNGDYN